MPWRATNAEQERLRFIALWETGLYRKSELCARFDVSRPTGDALLKRWAAEGVAGLKDRSRAPKSSPQRIAAEVAKILIQARLAHQTWGPRKIRAWLSGHMPELPAASTIGELYVQAGLVERRQRQRRWRHPGRSPVVAESPNDLWTTDFKGQFRTRDGRYCYPLTVADAQTRFLLAVEGLTSIGQRGARETFERLFRAYGLPRAIRSDNGSPFCSKAIAGLSQLSVWWTQLGIEHDRIAPGRPEQNGAHERMHRTLKQATLWPPARDHAEQQGRFDAFRGEYNRERPHEALAMATPGALYTSSPRQLPERIEPPSYPGHCRVRRLRRNGILYFRDRSFFVSELLAGEDVGIEEVADGVWSLYYYDLLLARLDERTWTFSG